jgi:hypothetical protein
VAAERKRFLSWEDRRGKEVISMRYEKPELVALGLAIEVVQSHHKTGGICDSLPSDCAYEADE